MTIELHLCQFWGYHCTILPLQGSRFFRLSEKAAAFWPQPHRRTSWIRHCPWCACGCDKALMISFYYFLKSNVFLFLFLLFSFKILAEIRKIQKVHILQRKSAEQTGVHLVNLYWTMIGKFETIFHSGIWGTRKCRWQHLQFFDMFKSILISVIVIWLSFKRCFKFSRFKI